MAEIIKKQWHCIKIMSAKRRSGRLFAEYRKRGITFVRDGGDALHVSEYASKIAPQYGIDYRSPMFAIHRKGHYGRIVGCAWEDLEEYRDLVKKVKDLGGDFIKI